MRHPLPLLTREVRPIDLTANRSLLLAQDLHSPFTDPENGALGQLARAKVVLQEFDEYFDTLQLVDPNFSSLLTSFREVGIPVAFSCLGHRSDIAPSAFQVATGWRWGLDDQAGLFPVEWTPRDGEPVFEKPGWGALANPKLRQHLHERSIENVVIFGAMFDFGIRQTCYELTDMGIGNLVVSDAVIALTRAGHASTAGNIAHGMTKLRSTAEVLELLKTLDSSGMVRI